MTAVEYWQNESSRWERKVEEKKRSKVSYMKLTFATLKPLLRGRRKTEQMALWRPEQKGKRANEMPMTPIKLGIVGFEKRIV